MDLFGFDDESDEVFLDEAIPRDEITEDPEIVIRRLREVQDEGGMLDGIMASSGYGIPFKKAVNASSEEVKMATFVTERDLERRLKIIGLRKLMMSMRKTEDLNIYFSPGVVQLPTVPEHRKANRVDMGTSDKVYTVALAVKDQAERLGIEYDATSLIVVEIGFAYTSAMAVESGQIVDAMAGTAGFPGYMGMGFMDSELSYALVNTVEDLSKMAIFQGGSANVGGLDPLEIDIETFVKLGKAHGEERRGYEMMLESIVKDVASLLPVTIPKEVVLSGRFTRIPEFMKDIELKLRRFLKELGRVPDIVNLQTRGGVCKEASEGSAILANGVVGGRYEEIVETLKLKGSEGSVFDHLYLSDEYTDGINNFGR